MKKILFASILSVIVFLDQAIASNFFNDPPESHTSSSSGSGDDNPLDFRRHRKRGGTILPGEVTRPDDEGKIIPTRTPQPVGKKTGE
jgi:hypothetical protein